MCVAEDRCAEEDGDVTCDRYAESAGWSQFLSNDMEVKKFIGKSLHPARPIRRFVPEKAPLLMVNFRAECKDCYKEDFMEHYNLWCSFNEMMNPKPEAIPEKKLKAGRITYSRDFLLQLSGLSASKQKPKYLPDHPVVLEHPVLRSSYLPQPYRMSLSTTNQLPELCETGNLSAANAPA
ncbi:uncharacterized protein C8orf88 homolog isoform X2 [Hyperolius riggenbachi]|uniref:uncharacterized protein C8orf88 homolog isoform X2 n=1 Tax=Hyperolius riggenbachi TaxID=752182 RepID=UPI0035A3B142